MDNKRRKGKRREKVTSKAICMCGVVDITLLTSRMGKYPDGSKISLILFQ